MQNPLGYEPIPKLILKFAIPSVLSLVVYALYNIADQIFIGHGVGYLGNGATNVIFPLTILILSLATMLGDGCAAYMSLQLGKGNKTDASVGVCNTMISVVVVGIVFTIVSLIFLEPLCMLFGATEQNLPYALEYGRIIVLGFLFSAICASFSAIVRADGNPKYSMIGLLIGCATNVVLDPIFIFVFKMGVAGAAWATILGQIFNAILLIIYIRKFKHVDIKKEYFKIQFGTLRKVISLGVSSLILQLSIVVMVTCTNKLLVKYGAISKYGADIPMAAMGIAMKVNQIVIQVIQGIAIGAQPIIGFNYGAGQYDRTKQAFRIVIITALMTSAVAWVVFEFFPMSIVTLFGSETALFNEFATKCFRIFLLFCVVNGFHLPVGFFFQAVGKPLLASINTLMKQIIIVIPAMFILSARVGVEGPLWAGPVSDVLAFIIAVILYKISVKKIYQ